MAGNGTETQSNQYDANGRLATQTVFNSVSAGVGQSVKGWAGDVLGTSAAATFTARTLGSIAAGTTALAMRGGRISAAQVAVDAFGNVIGAGIADMNGQRTDVPVFGQNFDWGAVPADAGYANQGSSDGYPASEYTQAAYDQLVDVFGQASGGVRQPGVQLADNWAREPSSSTVASDAGNGRAHLEISGMGGDDELDRVGRAYFAQMQEREQAARASGTSGTQQSTR